MVIKTLSIGYRMVIKCNTCNLQTNHELKAVHIRHVEEEDNSNSPFAQPSWWIDYEYRFWVCLGCDTAILQELLTPMNDSDLTESTFYPSRRGGYLDVKNFIQLDDKLKAVYREVVQSYNTGLKIVCGMGLRALLEGICVNKGITDKKAYGLEAKLGKLEEYTHLPSNIVESLYSFKFIGDDAAHRLESTSKEELKLGIEVMEDLLNFLYDVEYKLTSKAQELGNKRPEKIAEIKQKRITKSKNTKI